MHPITGWFILNLLLMPFEEHYNTKHPHPFPSKKVHILMGQDLSCIKKIIKHQEKLYNMIYRDGRWIRRYNVIRKKNDSY